MSDSLAPEDPDPAPNEEEPPSHSYRVTPTIRWVSDALVVEELDVDILAGTPFMTYNDILVRPSRRQISIRGSPLTQACLISINH